jgi:hypothetical protein
MTNAIHIDSEGNVSDVDLDLRPEAVHDDLHERLACRKHVQIRLTAVTYLVIDASGRINGKSVNAALTAFAAKYGHTEPIYGDGIIVGHDFEGDIDSIRDSERAELANALPRTNALATI